MQIFISIKARVSIQAINLLIVQITSKSISTQSNFLKQIAQLIISTAHLNQILWLKIVFLAL